MWVYTLPGTLDDDEVAGLLWEAGAAGLEERSGQLRASFAERAALEDWPQLAGGEWTPQEERDWQAEWKRSLKPVRAGRITVVPGWLRAEVPGSQLALIIEPGMAFGTGHHATTRMAIEALSALDLAGRTVLDVGSGSGVLAIAASLLGAGRALGLDIDPLTVPVAIQNAVGNGFVHDGENLRNPHTGQRLAFLTGTLGDQLDEGEAWDVLVANLYAELHDLLAPDYRAALGPGGGLILTGILEERLPLVRSALVREGFEDVQQRLEGEWALVTARSGG